MAGFNIRDWPLSTLDAVEEVAHMWSVLHRAIGLFGENFGSVIGPGSTAIGSRWRRWLIRLFATRGLRSDPEPPAINKERPLGSMKLHSIAPKTGSAGVTVQTEGVVIKD